MNKKMKTEINDIIKHLPVEMSDMLMSRLDELQGKEVQLDAFKSERSVLLEKVRGLEELKNDAEAIDRRKVELDGVAKSLHLRQVNAETVSLKYELEQEKRNTQRIYDLAAIVFKTVKPLYNTFGNMPVANNDGCISQEPFNKFTQEQE